MAHLKTTLEEDLALLGMESLLGSTKEEEIPPKAEEKSGEKLESEEEDDDFKGVYVTKALFDRIENLPVATMEEKDFNAVLEALLEKKIPDGDDALAEQAERVVAMLKEGVADRQRRFKAGSTARKVSFQCPQGTRAMQAGGGRPQCRPSHIVAGGMGNLNKESRAKKKWSRSGKGTMSKLRSFRAEKRRTGMREGLISPLAQELMQVSESVMQKENVTVRDEIVERIVNIMEFLNEEFCDASVFEIYSEQVESMLDTYEAGRLEEDVMEDEEFIAELSPLLTLITKSVNRLDGDMGNE